MVERRYGGCFRSPRWQPNQYCPWLLVEILNFFCEHLVWSRDEGLIFSLYPFLVRCRAANPGGSGCNSRAGDLVVMASSHALGPERSDVAVYVLNMGQPVKIVDLAERMIRLSGLEPGRDV